MGTAPDRPLVASPPRPRCRGSAHGGRHSVLLVAGLLIVCTGGTRAVWAPPGASSPISSLQAARALAPPPVVASEGGELEGYEFWEENDDLLTAAWQELGPSKPDLYTFGLPFERLYLRAELREAALAARTIHDEAPARGLFEEIVPGVFATGQLFSEQFLKDMLAELEHIEDSGIPRRRPNGMNRYGVILDQVGMEAMFEGLVSAYLRPLAAMLFPELVGEEDVEEHYAFTVRYEATGDTELAKHGDASVVTLNLCLGQPGWEGGSLRFFESGGTGMYALPRQNESAGAGEVFFRPGMAVIHRGQHRHQALPLLSGVRTNLVVWLMGRDGVVRVMPYTEEEQLTVSDRWDAAPAPAPAAAWNLEA